MEEDSVIIDALKVKISLLEMHLRNAKKDTERLERSVKEWKNAWEEERTSRVANRDRFDAAIEKLYEWVGEEAP